MLRNSVSEDPPKDLEREPWGPAGASRQRFYGRKIKGVKLENEKKIFFGQVAVRRSLWLPTGDTAVPQALFLYGAPATAGVSMRQTAPNTSRRQRMEILFAT